MKTVIAFASVVFVAVTALAEPQRITMDGGTTEARWSLKELNPELPSDWSEFDFLTIEMKSTTAQRFELRLFTPLGVRKVRMQPFQGAWIRAALPLAFFEKRNHEGHDLASLGNKSRAAYWVGLTGSIGPLTHVEAIGVGMENPIGAPTIEIRSVRLDKQSPGDAVLEPKPLVDEFGQWTVGDWPGKAQCARRFEIGLGRRRKITRAGRIQLFEVRRLQSGTSEGDRIFPCREIRRPLVVCRSGGVPILFDRRRWYVALDGHQHPRARRRVQGPTAGGVEAAIVSRNQSGMVSFYSWNLLRRFGSNWPTAWTDLTLRRMDAWGLNTIANWADPRLGAAQRKAYIVMLRGWGIDNSAYLGLPDVFADDYVKRVDAAAAEQCGPHKDDPWLLGYFIANEPPWPGRESDIVAAILAGPASPIQAEAKKFLAEGDTTQRRRDFVNMAVERFVEITSAALKKHDPNHLNLGLRFGTRPTAAMLRASRHFDVFSMNSYGEEVNRANVEAAYRITEKPIVIGEFHFGTPGRGLAAGLVQTKNQEERGVAYRYYVENAAAHPAIIGVHWFEWLDEPNTGRFDGENYNIGMIDVTDRPYAEFVDAMKTTHARVLTVHNGQEPPVTRKALVK